MRQIEQSTATILLYQISTFFCFKISIMNEVMKRYRRLWKTQWNYWESVFTRKFLETYFTVLQIIIVGGDIGKVAKTFCAYFSWKIFDFSTYFSDWLIFPTTYFFLRLIPIDLFLFRRLIFPTYFWRFRLIFWKIYTFWNVMNTIWLLLENICQFVCLWQKFYGKCNSKTIAQIFINL